MTGILTSYKGKEKYIPYMAILVILGTIIFALRRYPLFSLLEVGDEAYYRGEVDFLTKYGAFHSFAQGTSYVYSCLVLALSKLFFTTHLVGARILSLLSFLICCWLLLKCLERFPAVTYTERFLCIAFYSIVSKDWIMKGLPDIPAMMFFLAGLYFVLQPKNNRQLIFAGILVFMGFACKPVVLLTLPGLLVLLFFRQLKKDTWQGNALKSVLFVVGFTACFIVYHIPGYMTYHALMLENKEHVYEGDKRIDSNPGRREVEIYFVTVPNEHQSILKLSFEEVAIYKEKHPEVNLNLSYSEYVTKFWPSFLKNSFSKIFLVLPYYIQSGFFFSKWTSVNRWINDMDIIRAITILLLSVIFFIQRRFIGANYLYFILPFSYAAILAFYSIGHYEDNWLLLCMPFMALPIIKFLCRYINIYLLLGLQFIFIWIH